MGTRRDDKLMSLSPGPGVYDANRSLSKDRVISYKIG